MAPPFISSSRPESAVAQYDRNLGRAIVGDGEVGLSVLVQIAYRNADRVAPGLAARGKGEVACLARCEPDLPLVLAIHDDDEVVDAIAIEVPGAEVYGVDAAAENRASERDLAIGRVAADGAGFTGANGDVVATRAPEVSNSDPGAKDAEFCAREEIG